MNAEQIAAGYALVGTLGYLACQIAAHRVLGYFDKLTPKDGRFHKADDHRQQDNEDAKCDDTIDEDLVSAAEELQLEDLSRSSSAWKRPVVEVKEEKLDTFTKSSAGSPADWNDNLSVQDRLGSSEHFSMQDRLKSSGNLPVHDRISSSELPPQQLVFETKVDSLVTSRRHQRRDFQVEQELYTYSGRNPGYYSSSGRLDKDSCERSLSRLKDFDQAEFASSLYRKSEDPFLRSRQSEYTAYQRRCPSGFSSRLDNSDFTARKYSRSPRLLQERLCSEDRFSEASRLSPRPIGIARESVGYCHSNNSSASSLCAGFRCDSYKSESGIYQRQVDSSLGTSPGFRGRSHAREVEIAYSDNERAHLDSGFGLRCSSRASVSSVQTELSQTSTYSPKFIRRHLTRDSEDTEQLPQSKLSSILYQNRASPSLSPSRNMEANEGLTQVDAEVEEIEPTEVPENHGTQDEAEENINASLTENNGDIAVQEEDPVQSAVEKMTEEHPSELPANVDAEETSAVIVDEEQVEGLEKTVEVSDAVDDSHIQSMTALTDSEVPQESPVDEEVNTQDTTNNHHSGTPPNFVTELTNMEYAAGNALMLTAQVSGDPMPDACWFKDGQMVDMGGRVLINSDDGTLSLSVLLSDPRDAGLYKIEVYNEHGRVSSEAEVILQKPEPGAPVFTDNVANATKLLGDSVEFTARITGQPKPKVHWQFNDKPIKAGSSYKLERDEDLCKLTVLQCSEELAGRYACVAKNSAGLARSEATLKVVEEMPVEEPVPTVTQPSSGAVDASGEATLSTNDQARQDQEDAKTPTPATESHPNYRYGPAATGAAEKYLTPVERPVKPATKESPFFLKTIGDTEVFGGMQAKFTACITGHPQPEYEWFRNGIRIYPSDRIAMQLDESGVLKLTMRNVDSTDAGRYKLTIFNQHGHASCEADLTYDSFDMVQTRPLKDQYHTLEWQLKSGVPMPLVDPPIISRMTDCQLILSWRPSPPAGQSVPVTYQVEMCQLSGCEWSTVKTGVRGCSIEVKNLQADKDYKFRVRVENKHGVSEASSHVTTQRERLLVALKTEDEFLPVGEKFKPGLSNKFPRDFDMERWNRRRPQPPTGRRPHQQADGNEFDGGGSWDYDRFSASVRRPTSCLPDVESLRPVQRPLSRAEAHQLRPDPAGSPATMRRRPLTDDVDSRRSPRSGRMRRQTYADEWETKRGAHIVERLLVRRQVDDAGREFRRSAGYETRELLRRLPPIVLHNRRRTPLQWDDEETQAEDVKKGRGDSQVKDVAKDASDLQSPLLLSLIPPRSLSRMSEIVGNKHVTLIPDEPLARSDTVLARDWHGEFQRHLQGDDSKPSKLLSASKLTSVTDWESRFLDSFETQKLL